MKANSIQHRFENLYEERHRSLYAFVLKRTGSTYITEEIVQNTFIRWWELVSSGRGENLASDQALYLIAKGLLIDEHRKSLVSKRLAEAYCQQTTSEVYNEQRLSLKDLEEIICQAIDQLPPRRQRIFQMSRFEELSYQEIANHLGISIHTVESQMVKAIRELRQKIRPHISENLTTSHLLLLLYIYLY